MMITNYVIAGGTDPVGPPPELERAQSFGIPVCTIGDPTGLVSAYPSVVITSLCCAPQVIPDDQRQATLAEVQAAQATASAAEGSAANALTSARQGLSTLLAQKANLAAQLQADAAHIASLTPGSTLDAETIAILGRILNEGLGSTMQAHIDHLTVNGITS